MSKVQEKWKQYLDQIPGMPSRLAPPKEEPDDESIELLTMLEQMPSGLAAKVVNALEPPKDTPWERLVDHKWCLCEMAEGDFPRVFCFSSLRSLAEAIAKREGTETAVWPLFGMPLGVSKALNTTDGKTVRYLFLPNDKAAVVGKDVKFEIVDQSLLPQNVEMQDEGWLGDPTYVEGKSYYEEGFIEADSFTSDPDMEDDGDEDSTPTES